MLLTLLCGKEALQFLERFLGTFFLKETAAIVASYRPRAAAEKRALALSKRWPKFHWEVFQPPSQTLNFVVIGKNLSEDKAEALREHARQAGISNDVYIQRFE